MSVIATTTRLLVLLVVSWLLIALTTPTPDPLVVNLGWLVMIGLVLSIPTARRVLSRWISTGRLKRTAA